jgi:DNA repair protein RadD
MQLRDYQGTIAAAVTELIASIPNASPCIVSATGTGKTVTMAWLVNYYGAQHYQACIAHRRELVSQIARDLARRGIKHRIVGPSTTVAECRRAQLEELGYHHVDQTARVGVCSVDTLIARDLSGDSWARSVAIAHWDEAHHCTPGNKWDRARTEIFPALRSNIGYTATPRRADRKPLRGFFTHMIEGPPMWQQIENGYLTPYKLITGNVTDLDLSTVSVAASGDYNPQKLRGAMKRSRQIVGDAVSVYRQYCDGRKAVLFACDVEDAVRYAEAFNAAGYPSAVVTAETKEDVRRDTMRRFRTGELLILMNVDLFGEGFDLPAIECVLMCRPTKSLPLYQQQFGRALRLMVDKALMKQWHLFTPDKRRAHIAASSKPHAYIVDLVRNWAEPAVGGLPDARGRVWSLDGAEARSKGPSDVPPVRACTNPEPVDASGMLCTGVYERFLCACPFCGYAPVPTGRTIEQVDGDVVLLDEETLRQLRGEYLAAHTTPSFGGPHAAALYARHRERHTALTELQRVIEWWGPMYEIEQGRKLTDREQQKAFFLVFGITTLEALALKRADAEALRKKVLDWIELKGFTIPV